MTFMRRFLKDEEMTDARFRYGFADMEMPLTVLVISEELRHNPLYNMFPLDTWKIITEMIFHMTRDLWFCSKNDRVKYYPFRDIKELKKDFTWRERRVLHMLKSFHVLYMMMCSIQLEIEEGGRMYYNLVSFHGHFFDDPSSSLLKHTKFQ